MAKVNEFEKFLINDGLNKVKAEMVAEIENAVAAGKTPIMTAGFVEEVIGELKAKLKIKD